MNGVHSLQNNFLLDGIDNNTFSENVQELSTEASHPSVDVIAQFNVITSPYSAEYGRAPGGVVSVNTRSGSNNIHGAAYYYVRNQYFDSFDYFTKQTTNVKPENNQNQYGGSFGGPIKKDRIFGFFNYEGTRIKQGLSRISTVPLDNERIGDFSAAAAANAGVPAYPTVYNLSTCSAPYTATNCVPLVNNSFQSDPTAKIDSASAKLIALFPEPNDKQGGATYPEFNNFARTGAATDFNSSYDGRGDWTPSQKDTVFGRFNYFKRTRQIPGYFGGLADGTGTSAWGNQSLSGASFVLGWTHVFRPICSMTFGSAGYGIVPMGSNSRSACRKQRDNLSLGFPAIRRLVAAYRSPRSITTPTLVLLTSCPNHKCPCCTSSMTRSRGARARTASSLG